MQAEKRIFEAQENKEYLPIEGMESFRKATVDLLLGHNHPASLEVRNNDSIPHFFGLSWFLGWGICHSLLAMAPCLSPVPDLPVLPPLPPISIPLGSCCLPPVPIGHRVSEGRRRLHRPLPQGRR